MSGTIDFNDEIFESKYKEYSIIPKGSVLPMILYLERDKDNDDQATNIFKESSKDNDVVYINSKCIVTSGEYKGAALWNVLTVKGGQVGGDGKALAPIITGRICRSIIESSRGIASNASDPNSAASRKLKNGWMDLHGLEFLGKVNVIPAKDQYAEKNTLLCGIPPGHKEWYEWRSSIPTQPSPEYPTPEQPIPSSSGTEPPTETNSSRPEWATP